MQIELTIWHRDGSITRYVGKDLDAALSLAKLFKTALRWNIQWDSYLDATYVDSTLDNRGT